MPLQRGIVDVNLVCNKRHRTECLGQSENIAEDHQRQDPVLEDNTQVSGQGHVACKIWVLRHQFHLDSLTETPRAFSETIVMVHS